MSDQTIPVTVLPLDQSPLEKPKWSHQRYIELVKKHERSLEALAWIEAQPESPGRAVALKVVKRHVKDMRPPTLTPLTEEKLYSASDDCPHVADPWNYSGVQCLYCTGWFCF